MALQQDMTLANALARRNSHLWQQSGQERQIEAQEDAQEKAAKAQQEGQAAQQMRDDVQRMTGVGLQQQNLAHALESARMKQAFEDTQGAKDRAAALKRATDAAEINTRPDMARIDEQKRAALIAEALRQKQLEDVDAHYKRMDNRPVGGRGGGSPRQSRDETILGIDKQLSEIAAQRQAVLSKQVVGGIDYGSKQGIAAAEGIVKGLDDNANRLRGERERRIQALRDGNVSGRSTTRRRATSDDDDDDEGLQSTSGGGYRDRPVAVAAPAPVAVASEEVDKPKSKAGKTLFNSLFGE